MKKLLIPLVFLLLISGCSTNAPYKQTLRENETLIYLTDDKIYVQNEEIQEEGDVYLAHDIIYYEDRDTYDSGLPYGEGEDADRHSAEEANAHKVIHITKAGTYRVKGSLSKGQIFIDLKDEAKDDESAVVNLILDNVDLTCTVAPAIFFYNVYEADQNATQYLEEENEDYKATLTPNLEKAGANVYLEENSINNINGSYVARIYKDAEGEEKLHKYDGAFYSKMSMNIDGPGTLNIVAENEGLDSEMHLTIHNGNISIQSDNDGINTNEDNISVTTVNGGTLKIVAGLGEEGDGIDSNGYLVINGGTIITSANVKADAGVDADLGVIINGGTLVALGSSMPTNLNESTQASLNIEFKDEKEASEKIVITDENDQAIFAFDASLLQTPHKFKTALISSPNFTTNQNYKLFIAETLSGEAVNGIYAEVKEFNNATLQNFQMNMMNPMEGFKPEEFLEVFNQNRPEKPFGEPEGFEGIKPEGEFNPEDFDPDNIPGNRPNDFMQVQGESMTSFSFINPIVSLTNVNDVIESE